MNIRYQKPKIEPRFAADIYKTKINGKVNYEILVGKEGSEIPDTKGKSIGFYDSSNFLSLKGINDWINKQVNELKEKGKRVMVRGNISYGLVGVLNSLPSV